MTSAIVPYQAPSRIRGGIELLREYGSPLIRAANIGLTLQATQKEFKPLTNLIQVKPALANLVEPLISKLVTKPVLRVSTPFLFETKQKRLIALTCMIFSLALMKMGPSSFSQNLAAVSIASFIGSLLIDHFILAPLNTQTPAKDSVLYFDDKKAQAAKIANFIRSNPEACRIVAASLITAIIAIKTYLDGATDLPNTNFAYTSFIFLCSLGLTPDALSNLFHDISVGCKALTHAYRAQLFLENLAKDPAGSIQRAHQRIRFPQIQDLYRTLSVRSRDLLRQINVLEDSIFEKQRQITGARSKVTKMQAAYDTSFSKTPIDYQGLLERHEGSAQRTFLDQRSVVTQAQLEQRKTEDLAQKNTALVEAAAALALAQQELSALQAQALIAKSTSQAHFTAHPEEHKKLSMIRKHNTSYDVFQRRISYAQGGQLLASGAGRLLGLGAGSSVGAGYLDGKAQQLSSAVSGIVKETSHKLISPHVSKVFLTQIVFPWLFASLLYMTNINVSHKGIETLSNTMGWIGFSFILYQFSQVYSTQAIAQEKAVSFEDSLLMETLLKKLDAPKQAVARSGISEVLGTLEDQTLSTMRRVELGLSGSIKLASVVPGVPKSVHSVLYHTQQGLTSLELAFSIMQSSQAASASEDSDEEAPLLTAVVSSASMGSGAKASSERGPKLGFSFELGEALKGVYAQTSPAEILQSEPRFRL